MPDESPDRSSAFSRRPIPCVSIDKWKVISNDARESLLPLIIPGLFSAQALTWSPQRLVSEWGEREINVVVDLPESGVPYAARSKDFQRKMKLAEFISLLQGDKPCYLNQASIRDYPDLNAEIDIPSLSLGRIYALNLWVGNKTRSGLHFDNADNLFGQFYGRKRASLVSPESSKSLYPFLDCPSKSQVNLDTPDFKRHPNSKKIEVWEYELSPGDALYIPRGWWHHICSEGISMSINCWHGSTLSDLEYIRLIFAAGFPVVYRAVYDFIWHGLLARPYQYRLFSPPPPGLRAYQRLKWHH